MVHEFEIFHGIVLTKIVRSDRPITLRMIETRTNDDWSVYTLNDVVELFIKYTTAQRKNARDDGGKAWSFGFSTEQVKKIRKMWETKDVFIALVGGGINVKKDEMQVCLLLPEEVKKIFTFEDISSRAITLKSKAKQQYSIFIDRKEWERKIPKNRIERWEIPGS